MPWSKPSRAAALVAIVAGAAAHAQEDDPSLGALRAMSDWLAAQPTLAIEFDSAIEVIALEIEKLQIAGSGEELLARPDRFCARRESGQAAVEMAFDAKALIRTLRTVAERLDAWLGEGHALTSQGAWQTLAFELGVSRAAV
jgi:hypothetical protein